MKRITTYLSVLPLLLGFGLTSASAQVNYISPFTGNDGAGNGLFGNCFADGNSNMFLDWDVFVDAGLCGTGSAGGGQGSDCKAVIRGITLAADGSSVIASDVVCEVPGNYNGENGNNDIYFANLNICGLQPGRYSVEIHCDCQAGDYDNATGGATAATTWDYAAPESPSYYYGGTAGACGAEAGLEEFSVNGDGTGGWRESDDICGGCVSPQLEYFTVGDADAYRSMVVINGLFMDMGKFQPGNPALPSSLNDLQALYDPGCVGAATFPTAGFCGSDVLTLDGAEVNTMKNISCGNADITGNRLCYQVYETGTVAPGVTCVNIPYMDDCPPGYQGGTAFPMGGSCMNQGCALDQRWQSQSLGVDLLALAPTAGNYTVEFYTETDIVDCTGTASTIAEPPAGAYTTAFDRLDDASTACGACEAILPVWNN